MLGVLISLSVYFKLFAEKLRVVVILIEVVKNV